MPHDTTQGEGVRRGLNQSVDLILEPMVNYSGFVKEEMRHRWLAAWQAEKHPWLLTRDHDLRGFAAAVPAFKDSKHPINLW